MAQLNINKLLKEYGLTQKDLAECTGINKNTISKYCNDTFENINKTHIDLICKFFDCSPNDLFEIDKTVEVKNPNTIIFDDETDKFELTNRSIKELKCILNNYSNSKTNGFTPYYNYQPIDLNDIKPIAEYKKNSAIHDISKAIFNMNFNTWKDSFVDLSNENNNTKIKSSNKDYCKTARKVLEQQAKRLELECDFEDSVNILLDSIIYAYDPIIKEHYKELLETYNDNKNFPLSFKLTSLYRVIYRLLSVQSDSGLRDFIKRLRDIYMSGDLIELTDEELKQLYDISNYYIDLLDN